MATHSVNVMIKARENASRKFGHVGRSANILKSTLKSLAGTISMYFGARAIASLIRYGAAFEKTMSRVSALTGAVSEDQQKLTKTAQRLGETTVFTAKQVAEGMSFLALAGFETNEIIAAMPATLNLAAAGQLELAQASDITAKIMRGMGLNSDELGSAVDVLAKAFTSANTDLIQLGEAMQYVGPIGRMAGKSLEELAAIIMVMSNAGIQASMAGTSLRQIIAALSGGTPAASKALKELGVVTTDSAGKLLPMTNIIDQFNERMQGMGKAEKTARIMTIFGKRAGPGMAALLMEGSAALGKYLGQLQDSAGTAEKIATQQLANVAGELTKISSVASGILINIFTKQQGWLKDHLAAFREGLTMMSVYLDDFGLTWNILSTKITLGMIGVWEETKHLFGTAMPELLNSLVFDWDVAWQDIQNIVGTALKNMTKDIRTFFFGLSPLYQILTLVMGETEAHVVKLFEGLEPLVSDLPDIFTRTLTDTEKALKEYLDELSAELNRRILDRLEGPPTTAEGKPPGEGKPGSPAPKDLFGRGAGRPGLQALEARFLTFAPGTRFNYEQQTARNTGDLKKELRELLKIEKELLAATVRKNESVTGKANSLVISNFK